MPAEVDLHPVTQLAARQATDQSEHVRSLVTASARTKAPLRGTWGRAVSVRASERGRQPKRYIGQQCTYLRNHQKRPMLRAVTRYTLCVGWSAGYSSCLCLHRSAAFSKFGLSITQNPDCGQVIWPSTTHVNKLGSRPEHQLRWNKIRKTLPPYYWRLSRPSASNQWRVARHLTEILIIIYYHFVTMQAIYQTIEIISQYASGIRLTECPISPNGYLETNSIIS
jgi:hypothetical protein